MFEGDTGMLSAIFAKSDFANARGFSNSKAVRRSGAIEKQSTQAMGGKHERKISRNTYGHTR
jgi:hypothetical protein